MLKDENIRDVFFKLIRAGLFGLTDTTDSAKWNLVDWDEVCQLAEEQSAIGLVTAGIEALQVPIPKVMRLQFIGQTLQIESRNTEMNVFVAELTEKLQKANVRSVLVKGQGVAQCYEKPLWRSCGDVDLLLDAENYEQAKTVLFPMAYDIASENVQTKHQAMKIDGFDVELHGRMPFMLSKRADRVIDEVLSDTFNNGGVSSWIVDGVDVKMPSADDHVFLVFTHFLHHFFIEGVGLRQICDWCRMLWTYRDTLDFGLLESRIRRAGLMSEWKVFYNLATQYLGMPDLDSQDSQVRMSDQRSSACFMVHDSRLNKKAKKIMEMVLKAGNFGHNKDLSYRSKYRGVAYKMVSLWRRLVDFVGFMGVFPLDAPRFFLTYVTSKVKE